MMVDVVIILMLMLMCFFLFKVYTSFKAYFGNMMSAFVNDIEQKMTDKIGSTNWYLEFHKLKTQSESYDLKLNDLESKNKILRQENNSLHSAVSQVNNLRIENSDLKNKIRILENKVSSFSSSNNTSVPNSELIKQAIDYAMKKSHPDNGGSQADFIKFRQLQKDYPGMVSCSKSNSNSNNNSYTGGFQDFGFYNNVFNGFRRW